MDFSCSYLTNYDILSLSYDSEAINNQCCNFIFVPLLLYKNNKSWNEFDDFDDPRLLVDWFKNRIKYTKMVLRALSVFSKSQTHILLLVDPIASKNNDISFSVNSILNYCSNPLHDANFHLTYINTRNYQSAEYSIEFAHDLRACVRNIDLKEAKYICMLRLDSDDFMLPSYLISLTNYYFDKQENN